MANTPMIREAIAFTLANDPGVAALTTNVRPLYVPEGDPLPAITYQVISNHPYHVLNGPSGSTRARVQITAHSKVLGDCQAITEAVRQLFEGLNNKTIFGPNGAVFVLEAFWDDEHDEEDDASDGTGRPYLRTVTDYVFRYRLPRPARLN